MIYSTYGSGLYYLEFREETPGLGCDNKKYWTLFKRNFIEPIEVAGINFGNEGHPWNLGGGTVDREELITAYTEYFLKFMVDALNEKVRKDTNGKMDEVFKAIDEAGLYDDDGGQMKVNTGL